MQKLKANRALKTNIFQNKKKRNGYIMNTKLASDTKYLGELRSTSGKYLSKPAYQRLIRVLLKYFLIFSNEH